MRYMPVRYTPMRYPPIRCTLVGGMPVRYVLIFENSFVVLEIFVLALASLLPTVPWFLSAGESLIMVPKFSSSELSAQLM
jgi:hypothetical protein